MLQRIAIATVALLIALLIPESASGEAARVHCPLGQTEANGAEAADWPTPPPSGQCVSFSAWEKEYKAAEAAHKAQKAATETEAEKAAETVAEEAATERQERLEENEETGGPVTFLKVTAVAHRGYSYSHPGHTSLNITTNRWAEVLVRITPKGYATETLRWKQGMVNEENEVGSVETEALEDPWSCAFPLLVEHYAVTVRGENGGKVEGGPGLTVTGYFTNQVSRKWCNLAKRREATIKKREAQAEARRFRQEVLEQERRERHIAERERAERQRFDAICRAIGGTPVGIDTSHGPETVCRSQTGGLISVQP